MTQDTSNSASFARSPRNTRTTRPNNQRISRVSDLQRHPASQPPSCWACSRNSRSSRRSSIRAPQDTAKLSWRQRRKWMMADPATWRDLLWMIVNPCVGAALAGGSAAAIVYGVFGMALPHGSTQLAGVISHPLYGILLAAFGFWAAPWLLRGYGEFARSLLGPTRLAELAQPVRHLAQT